MGELIDDTLEAETEVSMHRRMQRERQEAVRQIQLAVPAARRRRLNCIIPCAVVEVVAPQMAVEIALQVDDETRLTAVFDDAVQWLNAQAREVGVGGQCDDRAEADVLVETPSNCRLVQLNRLRVVERRAGVRLGEQRQCDAESDVALDLLQLREISAGFATHERDGGEPSPLLRATADVGPKRKR